MEEAGKRHLSVEETASRLNVSTKTVYTYLKQKKLTSKKDGKRLLIPAKDVEGLKTHSLQYNPDSQIVLDRADYEAMFHLKLEAESQGNLYRSQYEEASKKHDELFRKYEGLLVKLGQLEAEVRLTKEENQRLLEDKNFQKEKKPWWKRLF